MIESTAQLREHLAGTASDINRVMVHKFMERSEPLPLMVAEALAAYGSPPSGKAFGVVNPSERMDAVHDGATLQILYEGRTADTVLTDKHGFDTKFDDLFKTRSEAEILAIKKKYGASGDILEAEQRIAAIARDLVDHYSGCGSTVRDWMCDAPTISGFFCRIYFVLRSTESRIVAVKPDGHGVSCLFRHNRSVS